MENKKTEQMPQAVPYIVHEGAMVRNERMVKRLIIGLVISVFLLFASNVAWLYYLSGYDVESWEYSQDGKGINIIGNENGVNSNGTTAEDNEAEKKKQGE